MENKLTPQQIAEQQLADKIKPLIKELQELEFRKGNGVTLQKSEYIGSRTTELEAQIRQLKKQQQ